MRERELETRLEQLPDVGAADVIGLLDLDNAENLRPQCKYSLMLTGFILVRERLTWIDRKRARWRAAISW